MKRKNKSAVPRERAVNQEVTRQMLLKLTDIYQRKGWGKSLRSRKK
jgi:hypothetical protein